MRIRNACGIVALLAVACPARAADATAVPPAATQIRLRPFVIGAGPSAGVLVQGSVNGGPALRLLLDSGSQYVVLKRKAAQHSDCDGGSPIQMVGAGSQRSSEVKLVHGATVEVGAFVARDVSVLVTDRSLADGIDGVVPLSLFSDYLIRLDLPNRSLDLLPLPGEPDDSASRMRISANLLFVSCRVNRRHDGFFLLDTGAAYTVISRQLAAELADLNPPGARLSMRAATAEVDARRTGAVSSLAVGPAELAPGAVVAVDLSEASRNHRFAIHGLLGFSSLRDRVLLVNYRDSRLRIEQ